MLYYLKSLELSPFSPQILEEAARMGVQLLEGDWNAVASNTVNAAGTTTTATTALTNSHPSARQRRWTAFRSWYRGGRVFDRAHESLITAAMLRRPPSPGSQGRPLTPRIAPSDGPRPVAPEIEEAEEEAKTTSPEIDNVMKVGNGAVPHTLDEDAHETWNTADAIAGADATAAASAAYAIPKAEVMVEVDASASAAATAVVAAASEGGNRSRQVTPMEVLRCRASSHTPPPPPAAKRHVVLLRKGELLPSLSRRGGEASSTTASRRGSGSDKARGPGGAGGAGNGSGNGFLEENGWARAAATGGGISDAACLAAAEAGGEGDPYAAQVLDAARLDGLTGWEEDRARQGGELEGDYDNGDGNSGAIAEGLPPLSRLGGTSAAKRLRMEARRKFLEARTVTSKQAASKVSARSLTFLPAAMRANPSPQSTTPIPTYRNTAHLCVTAPRVPSTKCLASKGAAPIPTVAQLTCVSLSPRVIFHTTPRLKSVTLPS